MARFQLTLLSWQTDKLAEGYHELVAPNFDAAEQTFREIMQNYAATDQEVD